MSGNESLLSGEAVTAWTERSRVKAAKNAKVRKANSQQSFLGFFNSSFALPLRSLRLGVEILGFPHCSLGTSCHFLRKNQSGLDVLENSA